MSDPHEQDWTPQEPPRGFADGVMDRIAREERDGDVERVARWRRARGIGVVASLAVAASVALALSMQGRGASHGEAIARDREQVPLGTRAIAVLESGARVAWDGDVVNQSAGDVFYRVERKTFGDGTFVVHTPAGDVQVLGTCFRVRVAESNETQSEVQVNGRDIKAAVVGAAITAAALVTVYEGKVALSRANDTVTLTAGESARADARGIHRTGGGASGSTAAGGAADEAPGAPGEGDPLVAANANLAGSVRDYKQRLETIEAQKKGVEKQLAEAQEKLAVALNDGQALPTKSPYDLNQNDWKKLAEEGTVAAHYPCLRPDSKKGDEISASSLQKAGLPPSDGPILQQAMVASRARIWAAVRPLCVNALQGDAAMADKLGPTTCESLVRDVAGANGVDVSDDMRAVAEIRAGMRPMPADGGDAVIKLMMALTGESTAVEQDLAKQVGPDDAHAMVFGDESPGCWNNSRWGVGPRPPTP